jgi:chemotaxis protein MotB
LSDAALPVLKHIADNLKSVDSPINVQGFTDNVPIHNYDFASNWELSAARAVSVVRLLAREGIDPERLAAIGFGEYRPVASNATAEGRSRNRRVVLVIHTGKQRRADSESSLPAAVDEPGVGKD